MTTSIASQIAALLNTRNQLSIQYDAAKVLSNSENYVFIQQSDVVVAFAECKRVQWYQWEICHVSVLEKMEGQGYGSRILRLAENAARKGNARILQCTIRSNNVNSIKLFTRNDYKMVNSFHNVVTNNTINVYQKNICVRDE